jgi:hypothetical protein
VKQPVLDGDAERLADEEGLDEVRVVPGEVVKVDAEAQGHLEGRVAFLDAVFMEEGCGLRRRRGGSVLRCG